MLWTLMLLACQMPGDGKLRGETSPPESAPAETGEGEGEAACAEGETCDDGDACSTDDLCDADGSCAGTPMTCDTPPESACVDDVTLRVYEAAGSCDGGACAYPWTDQTCAHGCAEGACASSSEEGRMDWLLTASSDMMDESDGAALADGRILLIVQLGGPTLKVGGETLEAIGANSALLCLDEDGTVDWFRPLLAGGYRPRLSVGADGAIYVGFYYYESATLFPGEADELALSAAGDYDGALMRLDSDGALVWLIGIGGDLGDTVLDLTALPDGGVAASGYFGGHVTLGEGEPGETTLSGDSLDLYAAAWDEDGALRWAWGTTAPGWQLAHGIAASDDHIFLGGYFQTRATFPGAGTFTVPDDDSEEAYVAALTLDGATDWVSVISGSGVGDVYGVAATSDGGVALTGNVSEGSAGSDATFAEGEPEETTISLSGFHDLYTARWLADGTLAWAYTGVGEGRYGEMFGYSIAAGPDGEVLVVGATTGAARWNATSGYTTAPSVDRASNDLCYAIYDADGEVVWASAAGGAAYEAGQTAFWAPRGPMVLGSFGEISTFAPGEDGETTVRAADYRDLAIIALHP